MDIDSLKTDVEKRMLSAKSLNELSDALTRYSSGLSDEERVAIRGHEDEFTVFTRKKFGERQSTLTVIRFGPEERARAIEEAKELIKENRKIIERASKEDKEKNNN
jgi:hypothetical protein